MSHVYDLHWVNWSKECKLTETIPTCKCQKRKVKMSPIPTPMIQATIMKVSKRKLEKAWKRQKSDSNVGNSHAGPPWRQQWTEGLLFSCCLLSDDIMLHTLKTAMNWGLLLSCWANTFIFSDSSFSRSCFVFWPKPWKEEEGVILVVATRKGKCQDEQIIDWSSKSKNLVIRPWLIKAIEWKMKRIAI